MGPPGAGKEASAHAIHSASKRTGAFIFVSCPELHTESRHPVDSRSHARPEGSLLSSKLELASGGTLFLDAVFELPPRLQLELHEELENRERARARGEATVPDVRVIASTTRNLAHEAQSGRLGPLLRLLARNQIAVPALVDRREDIPVLVDVFVRRHARQLGKVIDGVSPESMRRLETYMWPGNVRELRSVLERAVLVCRSTVLEIDEELLDEGLAVGSYRLVTPLGSGGMGQVWLGRHRLLARPAAVKLIRHDARPGPAEEQLVRRFQREAQVTAGLRSPHTVQLYDFGVNDSGSFYYVMELLEGLDLHQIVTRFGPQPAERVTMLLRQACRSLAEAHEHGLVHRDIKPANLFVTRLGSEYDYLKVLDFGIVKDQPGQDATILTSQGILQGTPAFMAPELVSGEQPHRRQDRPLLARMHGVLGPHRTAPIPGEHAGADAPPPPADATGATVRGLGAAHSRGSRGHPDDVSREGSGTATVLGSRARCAACARFLRTGLDRREGARMVGCARSRPRSRIAAIDKDDGLKMRP